MAPLPPEQAAVEQPDEIVQLPVLLGDGTAVHGVKGSNGEAGVLAEIKEMVGKVAEGQACADPARSATGQVVDRVDAEQAAAESPPVGVVEEPSRAKEATSTRKETRERSRQRCGVDEDAAGGHGSPSAKGSDAARSRSSRRSSRRAERKARRASDRLEAQNWVQPFLDKHGFSSVKSKRRWLCHVQYPLHVAVNHRDADMVRLLLKAGASTSKADSSGRTPLALAEQRQRRMGRSGYQEVIAELQPITRRHAEKRRQARFSNSRSIYTEA